MRRVGLVGAASAASMIASAAASERPPAWAPSPKALAGDAEHPERLGARDRPRRERAEAGGGASVGGGVHHRLEAELVGGALDDALLDRAARDEAVDGDGARLADAVDAIHRLAVDLRVEVGVVEHDGVGGGERDPESPARVEHRKICWRVSLNERTSSVRCTRHVAPSRRAHTYSRSAHSRSSTSSVDVWPAKMTTRGRRRAAAAAAGRRRGAYRSPRRSPRRRSCSRARGPRRGTGGCSIAQRGEQVVRRAPVGLRAADRVVVGAVVGERGALLDPLEQVGLLLQELLRQLELRARHRRAQPDDTLRRQPREHLRLEAAEHEGAQQLAHLRDDALVHRPRLWSKARSKASDDAKISGWRKWRSAHSSCRLFCSGVPVSSSFPALGIAASRSWACDCSFLIRWASSSTRYRHAHRRVSAARNDGDAAISYVVTTTS